MLIDLVLRFRIGIRKQFGLLLVFSIWVIGLNSACDDETINRVDTVIRDSPIKAGTEAGTEAGNEAGATGGIDLDQGFLGGLMADQGPAGFEMSDQGPGRDSGIESCDEGSSYCDGETAVVSCIDGEYIEPVTCLNNERCLAGRCISNCERAATRADYQGCSFWAIDSDNIVDGEGNGPGAEPSAVVLSNVSENEATVLIEDAQGVVVHQTLLLSGQTQSFNLPRADLIGTHLGGKAWHVGTSQPVLAYQFTPLQRTSTSSVDATLLIPSPALDDSYRVLTWPGQGYNQRGTLSIIAVEEGPSTVTIVPLDRVSEGVDFRGVMQSTMQRLVSPLPNQAWTEVLERGDVLNVQSGPFADLSGTLVLSDQKLAVFAGTRCTNIPDLTPRCDHLEHQMLPLRNQGRNYIAPGGLPRAEETTWYRIVATVDQTVINTNPALPNSPIILNAGQVATLSSDRPFALDSNAPVMLGMFLASAEAGADGLGDPSFVLLPPVEQFKDRYVFLTPMDFERDGLTLIANGEAQITLDGQELNPTWVRVSDTRWNIAHLDIADGPHEISSAQEFAIIATGYDEEVSYAFTGGLRLEKLRESEPPPYPGLCADNQAPQTPCETGLMGICSSGRLSCAPGEEAVCQALMNPQEELCNRIDDDCDGLIDEAQCADFSLERIAPLTDRLTVTEGDATTFTIRAQGAASGQEVIWTVDGVPFRGMTGSSLEWTPLGFEEGAKVVSALVSDGERSAEVTWLVLVNDAPSNKAVIWGQVTLADDRSTAGLTLELSEGVSEGETVIDPRGYYAIAVEPSRYNLKIDTLFNRQEPFPKGILTLVEDIDVDRLNVRRDIVLPISKVSGVVSQADGQILANTEIEFDGDCFACSQETVSDANGAYEALLYHSTWEIDATPPANTGLPTKTINNFRIDADRILDIVFSTLYNISALVVDQYNQPVAGATITFDSEEAEISQASAADGSLNINLPSGDYLVQLDTLFYPRPPMIGKGIAPIIESFSIASDLANVVLPLPNAWVSGQVTRQGDGLPQASVELYFDSDRSCFACSGRTTTDLNGNYGLPLLHGRYAKTLSPPENSGYVNQDGTAIEVSADLEHDVVLQGPAVVVSGTLIDPRGDAVVGVGIRTNGPTEVQVTTDALGQFELRLLAGEYELKIDTLFGERPANIPTGWVNIWEGNISNDVTQVYTAPFAWISGRVQEAAGDVIPNAEINFNGDCFACSQEAISDLDGRYEAIVFQGIYNLEVTPPAPYPQQTIEGVDCTALDTVLDIDL